MAGSSWRRRIERTMSMLDHIQNDEAENAGIMFGVPDNERLFEIMRSRLPKLRSFVSQNSRIRHTYVIIREQYSFLALMSVAISM